MAFPVSPVDGQVYSNYRYNSTTSTWDDINTYGLYESDPAYDGYELLQRNPDLTGRDGEYWIQRGESPGQEYLNMTDNGGGWTLWANFGNNDRFGIGETGINSAADLTAKGFTNDNSTFNSVNYSPSDDYMTCFISGLEQGVIEKALPTWANEIWIKWGANTSTINSIEISGKKRQDTGGSIVTGQPYVVDEEYIGPFKDGELLTLRERSVIKLYYIFVRHNPNITTNGYGLSPETPGTSAKDILNKNPSVQGEDGWYYIREYGEATSRRVYCDMTYDGGGWTVVAGHDMEVSGFYPTTMLTEGLCGRPSTHSTTAEPFHGYLDKWPFYTEYTSKTVYTYDYGDGTTSQRYGTKYDTGTYGAVNANLVKAAYVDQNDLQGGRFSRDMAGDFAETDYYHPEAGQVYKGHTWFGTVNNRYYHWGQWDLMGKILSSDIFYDGSNWSLWMSISGVGAGWAETEARRAKQAYLQKGNYKSVLYVLVR